MYTVCVSNLGADTHIKHSAYLCASDRHLYTNKYTHIYKYAHIQVNVPKWCAGVCVYVLAYIHIWHPSVHPPPKKKFHHTITHMHVQSHTQLTIGEHAGHETLGFLKTEERSIVTTSQARARTSAPRHRDKTAVQLRRKCPASPVCCAA